MTSRPFRFGAGIFEGGSSANVKERARRAEDLGYDVFQVQDHLGLATPFPTLVSAATVTNMRLGTYVISTGLYRPALLARDILEVNRLVDGRLELGLGTGYNPAEFKAAGLPFPSGSERVDHLERTLTELRSLIDTMPPLLLAASGPRMLRLAGREADIVALSIAEPDQSLAKQIAIVREAAGSRFDDLELNLLIYTASVTDGDPDLTVPRMALNGMPDEQIRRLPGVLVGSVDSIADTLVEYRERYGLTYFTVTEPHMAEFAPVIAKLS